ncbi:hypothetical protein SAMN06298216_3158 [Spirosomataceae bacterium TFI 002]|nr:hypothetical protein SAMN06298216_3158 [Spirosomataceae bacterium TFI 002]
MSLEVLSSIKGATSSEAVDKLFEVIKSANIAVNGNPNQHAVTLDQLREDEVHPSNELERQIIRSNFPIQKNGYLVVSKVIEE